MLVCEVEMLDEDDDTSPQVPLQWYRRRHIFLDYWLQGVLDPSDDAYVLDIATPVHHDQDR